MSNYHCSVICRPADGLALADFAFVVFSFAFAGFAFACAMGFARCAVVFFAIEGFAFALGVDFLVVDFVVCFAI